MNKKQSIFILTFILIITAIKKHELNRVTFRSQKFDETCFNVNVGIFGTDPTWNRSRLSDPQNFTLKTENLENIKLKSENFYKEIKIMFNKEKFIQKFKIFLKNKK
jgi:hypothetical protein